MLEVKSVSLSIDKKQILSDVSFSAEAGKILAVCGPNGSGKTCLLKVIKGLLKEDGGSVSLDGRELKVSERLASIGLVFQDADVQTVGETVEKDVMFGPRNLGWDKETVNKNTEEALALLNLQDVRTKRPQVLSGGERRCLAIAGVLAMKTGTVLMDEPFANLDYPSVQRVLKAVLKLREEGICVIIVSHDIERFLAHADNVLVLDGGKKVFFGEPARALKVMGEHAIHVPDLPAEKLTWL